MKQEDRVQDRLQKRANRTPDAEPHVWAVVTLHCWVWAVLPEEEASTELGLIVLVGSRSNEVSSEDQLPLGMHQPECSQQGPLFNISCGGIWSTVSSFGPSKDQRPVGKLERARGDCQGMENRQLHEWRAWESWACRAWGRAGKDGTSLPSSTGRGVVRESTARFSSEEQKHSKRRKSNKWKLLQETPQLNTRENTLNSCSERLWVLCSWRFFKWGLRSLCLHPAVDLALPAAGDGAARCLGHFQPAFSYGSATLPECQQECG